MNILFIISSLLTVAVAQQPFLHCTYIHLEGFAIPYRCDLTINNPNGFNNFTDIGGIHLEGFTNADVGYVYRVNGITANIPSIVCETFPNLEIVTLYNAGITEIDDNSFQGCSRVYGLGLYSNRIASISSNAFVTLPNITYLYLDGNFLTTLPEDVFAAQQNLLELDISSNPLQNIPDGLFRPLLNLRYMYLSNANITAINNQWFTTNDDLYYLHLPRNRITLTADSFVGLESLVAINLGSNGINEIPLGTFTQLPNLQDLNLADNNITELQIDSFSDLRSLLSLVIDSNPIQIIREGAFRGLETLAVLSVENCRLRQIESNYFEGLGNLTSLSLNFNELEDLPQGAFASMPHLIYIGLWRNRLKTLRRNSFGTLTRLSTLDLDGNVVNALDRAIIDDAVNLSTLFFDGNLCANGYFGNFQSSRDRYLPMLDRCFRNMQYIVDTVTEGDGEYSFFEGPNPGIALRVNSTSEVHVALTPFDFIWNPVIEIIIGSTNNTRSIIRVNQETNVVTVPTPNVIARDQWNDFRITWGNQVILVFSGNSTLPFMGYTMQDFFPVNFYGLRAVETSASWSVSPFQ